MEPFSYPHLMGSINDDRTTLELLLRLAEFGGVVSEALSRACGGAAVVDNVSVIVLCQLELTGPLRPTDIADLTGLTSGGVTKVITRLENAGFITREQHALEQDKRAVSVELTDSGHELMRGFAHELGIRISDAGLLIKELNRLVD